MKTPTNGTFSIFRKRLGEELFYDILHQLIAQAIALKVILGGGVAVNATHLWAFSNKFGKKTCACKGKCNCPRKHSDADADWGRKTKKFSFFGYKVHLIVDAASQLPLDVRVTPAHEDDGSQAEPLVKAAKEKHHQIPIDSVAMDSSYDAYENYRFVIEDIGAAPIIALNPRGSADPLTLGSLTVSPAGEYLCLAGHKVVYAGKEKKSGRLKFRCPAAAGKCQCLFRGTCSSSAYGKTFHLHPHRNYRLTGPVPRGTELWKEKYKGRSSVERAYSEQKGSHSLANPRVRGLSNVKIHVYLALCAQIIKRVGTLITASVTRPRAAYPLAA
jgi:hypothetical protein